MTKNLWLAVGILILTIVLAGCASSAGAGQTTGNEEGKGLSEWPTAEPTMATATLTPFPKVTPILTNQTATATPGVENGELNTSIAGDENSTPEPESVSVLEAAEPAEATGVEPEPEASQSLPSIPDVAQAARVMVEPAGGLRQVDVYAGPGSDFEPVGSLVVEDEVSILATNTAHDWVLVKPVADYTNPGWIRREHLNVGQALDDVPEVVTGWVTSHAVPVRPAPSLTVGQVGTLALHDMVMVAGVDESRQWALVTPVLAGGEYVWAPYQFIDLGSDWATLPVTSQPAAETPHQQEQLGEMAFSAVYERKDIIVFQVASGGDIFVINQDGTGLRKLTTGVDPVLSPDGTQVAFTRWEYGGELGSLWVINLDGSNEWQILGEMRKAKGPDWSPDGTQIVLNYQAGGTTNDQQVCKPLSSHPHMPSNAHSPEVKMTADGPYLCWIEPADAHWRLRTVNVADGSFQDIDAGIYASRPAWDPYRVERIVSDSGYGLMESFPATGDTNGITDDMNEGSPVFSPDGRHIASTVYQGGTYEIHRLNGDGTGRLRLTKTPLWITAEPGDKEAWRNVAPEWSPDGSQIAFLTDRTGRWEIWVMNADGTDPHPMFDDAINDQLPLQYDLNDERVLSWR